MERTNVEGSKLCPKCGTLIKPPGESGGRPRRWCSPGCKQSTEQEMRRVGQVLKRLELDKVWKQRHGRAGGIERIDELIVEQQRRYDFLAGVPSVTNDGEETK
jgi:hypothetical protein